MLLYIVRCARNPNTRANACALGETTASDARPRARFYWYLSFFFRFKKLASTLSPAISDVRPPNPFTRTGHAGPLGWRHSTARLTRSRGRATISHPEDAKQWLFIARSTPKRRATIARILTRRYARSERSAAHTDGRPFQTLERAF